LHPNHRITEGPCRTLTQMPSFVVRSSP